MWFIQGHRFNIYEGIGPLAPIPNTYFQMFVTNGLCIIIGLVSSGFCSTCHLSNTSAEICADHFLPVGTLRAFMKRRRQFSELLKSNNNLTFNRYLRLMALAAIELLATIPLSIWLLVRDTQQPIYVWRGLGDMHSGYSRIEQYPTIEWMLIPGAQESLTLQPWLTISCAFVFFVFFGLAEEARTHYRLAFTSVAKRLGLSTGGSMGSSSGWGPSKGSKLGATIPSFVQRSFPSAGSGLASGGRRRSLDSFSDRLSTDISLGGDFEKGPYSPTDSAVSAFAPTPTDGNDERKSLPHVVRPDSGVVVGIEVITDRRSVDVPKSVRDDSHMVYPPLSLATLFPSIRLRYTFTLFTAPIHKNDIKLSLVSQVHRDHVVISYTCCFHPLPFICCLLAFAEPLSHNCIFSSSWRTSIPLLALVA